MSSALALRDDPESACSLNFLEPYAKGLIALSNTQGNDSGQRLGQIKDLFKDRLYLSLQDPTIGLPLSSLARKLHIPMVVTHPVYYLTPEQEKLQRTLTAIRLNRPIDQLPPDEVAPSGAYFTSQEEMVRRFSRFQPALERTQEIAERCKFDLPLGVAHMPKVPLPNGLTQPQYLRQKAEAGALQRYGKITPEIQKRLDHELEVIARLGYEPIFLIVEDVLNFARKTGVPYSSCGSAASSLVAHSGIRATIASLARTRPR